MTSASCVFVIYIYVGFTVLDDGEFGQGDRPAVLEAIDCEGTEDAVLSCNRLDDRVNCEFGDTAALHCAGKDHSCVFDDCRFSYSDILSMC